MLQLRNQTPFAAALAIFPDLRGVDSLILAVKATFTLASSLTLANEQVPVRLSDEPDTAGAALPAVESTPPLRYPGELSLCRPSTDVVILGTAYAEGMRPTAQVDVGVSVAGREVRLRVFGDREWTGAESGAVATAALPFVQMPINYRRAFGGYVRGEDGVRSEERNPVGVGFVDRQRGEMLRGRPLPNLEDPRQLLSAPGERPPPLSLGAIAPSWLPRRACAGTYDAEWQRQRAPFLPADFEPRFLQVAHPELVQPGRLRGGEPLRLRGLTREGNLTFALPEVTMQARVQLGTAHVEPALSLAQVLIEPDCARLELLFDAAVPCPKGALKVRDIELTLQNLTYGAATA